MGNVPKPFIQKMIKMKNLLRTKSVSESDSSSIQLYNKFNVMLLDLGAEYKSVCHCMDDNCY